jgi:hypothetical protein
MMPSLEVYWKETPKMDIAVMVEEGKKERDFRD